MATRSMSYDHPAYTVPYVACLETVAGANTVSAKFLAFTTMLLKSATIAVAIAGTTTSHNTDLVLSKVSGTTTTSVGAIAIGTAAAFVTTTNITLSGTLAQGEYIVAKNGTDATERSTITYEFLISPGSNVTA